MTRTVVVTPAQVDAAKTVIEWSESIGQPVPDSVRRIAEAPLATRRGTAGSRGNNDRQHHVNGADAA